MDWPLHGLTISGTGDTFALNVSRPDAGLISSFPLIPDEVVPLAKAISHALTSGRGPVNVSAIIREVTGRHMPIPSQTS